MMNSPRSTFDHQLENLLDQLMVLGSMVERAVLQSVSGLRQHDQLKARKTIDHDQLINERRYAIENEVITIIATQQPAGRDVRLLVAILEINTELERIGDYAKGISKITLLLPKEVNIPPILNDLEKMAEMGLDMLSTALDAFITKDVDLARSIPARDDAVDELYNQVHYQLIDMVLSDRSFVINANYLLWAAHNIERLADRVTNICERIVYVNTGEMKELDTFEETNQT